MWVKTSTCRSIGCLVAVSLEHWIQTCVVADKKSSLEHRRTGVLIRYPNLRIPYTQFSLQVTKVYANSVASNYGL